MRRYEHAAPGDLVHVDVKKLGTIPDGGGWRTRGRQQGKRNRSRLAYTEILADETRDTAVALWHRAHAWFTSCGITVRELSRG